LPRGAEERGAGAIQRFGVGFEISNLRFEIGLSFGVIR
jgi:hypothetical protein